MRNNTRKLVTAAILGALYAVLTMVLAPISYGPVQLRVSEVMCILPYFLPFTSWGLFFGCAVANLICGAGLPDIVFGSLATLISCGFIALCGKKGKGSIESELIACLMPVIFNALIVGGVLYYMTLGSLGFLVGDYLLFYAGPVALGEFIVMLAMGFPLMRKLPKLPFFAELLTKYD